MPIDPQGYPVQQYTNLNNEIVQQILSDGTIVLITGVTISSGSGDPTGIVVAPIGSLYIDKDGVDPDIWWQNQTGDEFGWVNVSVSGGGGAVTSVFGRSGAVGPFPTDYSNVANLTFGDTAGSSITFNSIASQLQLGDPGADLITLDGFAGKITIHGINEIDLNSLIVKVNGGTSITLTDGAPSHFKLDGGGGAELVAAGIINIGDLVNNLIDVDSGGGNIGITAFNAISIVGGSVSLALNDGGQDFNVNCVSGANFFVNTGSPDIVFQAGPAGTVKVNTVSGGKFQVAGLQVFANNAAAIGGGLVAGNFYRTGADPDVVCVVH